jgi:hypothetical protein
MVLIKIEAQCKKKRYKKRDRNCFRFLALEVFFSIWPLKKEAPPPPSKRVKGSKKFLHRSRYSKRNMKINTYNYYNDVPILKNIQLEQVIQADSSP